MEDKAMLQLFGNIASSMELESIPIAASVDLDMLKKADDDPLEVIVEIPASKSKRGWNYQATALKDIVDIVNSSTLNGFLGHQKPSDINNEFLSPVTHWIGAKLVGEIAYFRGIVDAAAKDLKRWIRTGRIKQVSIFGYPKISRTATEINVVGYDPLSIDWTPLDRAGMATRIVAMSGEMLDMDGLGPIEGNKEKEKLTPEFILEALQYMLEAKKITIAMLEEVVGDFSKMEASESAEKLKKIEAVLGASGEMDIIEMASDAANALQEKRSGNAEQFMKELISENVASTAIQQDIFNPQTVIGKMWSYYTEGLHSNTESEIVGEMQAFLNDDVVKGVISSYYTDKPAGIPIYTSGEKTRHLKIKRNPL